MSTGRISRRSVSRDSGLKPFSHQLRSFEFHCTSHTIQDDCEENENRYGNHLDCRILHSHSFDCLPQVQTKSLAELCREILQREPIRPSGLLVCLDISSCLATTLLYGGIVYRDFYQGELTNFDSMLCDVDLSSWLAMRRPL